MDNCCTPCCFEDSVSGCPEAIKVNAKLTPLTSYFWILTDHHGNKYSQEFVTDAEGYGIIDTTDEELPPGFCNPYNVGFRVEVKKTLDDCKVEELPIVTKYDCIIISVTSGKLEKNEIGCVV